MKRLQTTKESRHMKRKSKVENRSDLYRSFFLSSLKSVLPSAITHHQTGCPAANLCNPPLISCILSINVSTKVRVSVGSNLLPLEGENNKLQIHRESIIEVDVPKNFCILFHRNRTIHGGGASDCLNVRMFGLYGPENVKAYTENRTYTDMLEPCHENCADCVRLQRFKSSNNGNFIPPSKEKVNVLDCLNDFDLNDHGFCIVKVAKEVKNGGIQNQAELIGQEKNKGIRFHPIGQEETDNGGTREILDIGTELSSEVLMKNKMWSAIDEHLLQCSKNICSFLGAKYMVSYTEKGRSLLRSKGGVGNQILHLDGNPDCECTS